MKNPSILPRNPAHETTLLLVVSTICFFAALAGMIFKSTYDSANQWTLEVEDQLTVRILSENPDNAESLISNVNGVILARKMDRTELIELLQPSLESQEFSSDLPVPTLFAVTIDLNVSGVDEAIENALLNRNYMASVSSHSERSKGIRQGLDVIRMTSLVIIGLLTASAVGIIIIATHSSVVSQQQVARVLYLAGAPDGFIMRIFAVRFWVNIFLASLIGALLALGLLFLLMHAIGNVSSVEGWLPVLSPDNEDFLIPISVPIIASLLTLVTTRSAVLGILKKRI